MVAFDIPVFYIGESNRYVGYGEECTLWYNFSDDGIEEIEVTTYEFDLLISLQNETVSNRWNGRLFGHEELKDFVQRDEWDEMLREEHLSRLMEQMGI